MEKYWLVVLSLQEKILKARTIQEEERLEEALREVLDYIENLSAEEGH